MKSISNNDRNEAVSKSNIRDQSNVIRVDIFQEKKKDEEYKKALDKILLRAQKSDW